MTVAATPFVAENTIAPVSTVHGCSPVRSDQPVQTSTTGRPSMNTESAPRPSRRRAREHHVLEDLRLIALDGELAGLWLVAALHLVFDRERRGRQGVEANVFR